MKEVYTPEDHIWIRELLNYPHALEENLSFFEDTSEIAIPEDPIERVVFQERAKTAIRKIAQNRGHILMVGRPGTGKSMLAEMFNEVLDRSLGDFIRPQNAIVAFPGKDINHIRIAYEDPQAIENRIEKTKTDIESAAQAIPPFSLAGQIQSIKRIKRWMLAATGLTAGVGLFFPPAFLAASLTGIGSIFLFLQENNHRAQEKIQQETLRSTRNPVKQIEDLLPEILYDPSNDNHLMARISEPNARNMKGGFRHDPYQSGNLQTPAHKRAFLGAHAKSPIIYIDELKSLVKAGYMSELLEIMQRQSYLLEGGKSTGSGAADRAENRLRAENILIACCNHDTLAYLQEEGDGAFLSRIEDRGEIVELNSAVIESEKTAQQTAQYIAQEIRNLDREISETWGPVLEKEGYEGVRKRSSKIFGKALPRSYELRPREFSREAVMEIIKELRCRASDRKLSAMLRPLNGIIKSAEYEAILENRPLVEAEHVRTSLVTHMSLEGALTRDLLQHRRDLKKYISAMTDAIGYVIGLAVITSRSSGRMYGQPLPIRGQISAGGIDTVVAPGKIGDIAMAAAQNVRASIKKVLKTIDASYVGYEMHVEYIQAHGGVEGDSASVAIDIALISDYIKQPVNLTYGITGSITGDLILPVGGVTEKIRSIMDPDLGMSGACIPWQNKHDVEPLLINTEAQYLQKENIPGIRIYRKPDRTDPFDIYFCKTKYDAYLLLMGLDREAVENRMAERSRKDLSLKMASSAVGREETEALWGKHRDDEDSDSSF